MMFDRSGSMPSPQETHAALDGQQGTAAAVSGIPVGGAVPPEKRRKTIEVFRQLNYDLLDIGVALYQVVTSTYGEDAIANQIEQDVNAFNVGQENPTAFATVKVGAKEDAICLASPFRIQTDNFEAGVGLGFGGFVVLEIEDSYRDEAERFFTLVEEYLDSHSIYRGKAIKINREFLDLAEISPDDVVFSDGVADGLQSHLWSMIEQTERCRELGIPLQRKILLEGPYGAGKTLAGLITAKKAVENGWTFVYVPPTADEGNDMMAMMGMGRAKHPLIQALEFVRGKYEPAVVFVEDIDYEQTPQQQGRFNQLLSASDGLVSKDTEVMLVMTTNHFDQIRGAMLRPGRTDRVIRMGVFTREDVQRIILTAVPKHFLAPDIDWDAVANACEGYPPAFVRETGTGAALAAVGRSLSAVTEEMLVEAAKDLKNQHKKCEKDLEEPGQYL